MQITEAELIEIATRRRKLEDTVDEAKMLIASIISECERTMRNSNPDGRVYDQANQKMDRSQICSDDLESQAEACRDDMNRMEEALRAAGGVK